MAPCSGLTTALLVVGWCAAVTPSLTNTAESDHSYQLPFGPFSQTTASAVAEAGAAAQDDLPLLRSSVAGLYVNGAHSPVSNTVEPGRNTSAHVLGPITIYFDEQAVNWRTASLRVSAPRRRNWDDVNLRCGTSQDGYPVGGIEACEKDDLAAQAGAAGTHGEAVCQLSDVAEAGSGEAIFDPRRCGAFTSLLAQTEGQKEEQDELLSFTFTITVDAVKPHGSKPNVNEKKETVSRSWWVGHLRYKRASWPLAPEGGKAWSGFEPNKLSGLFHDPFLPKASHFEEGDELQGVDIQDAYWAAGISIRIPRVGIDEELEAVHAPVGGEVVWVSTFRRAKPPAPENDEKGWVVMIRDEWGFVWQLFRLAKHTITVQPGDLVPQGHVLGSIRRSNLQPAPPVRLPPADPPLEKPSKGTPKYPFRFRSLLINVARPNPDWSEWQPAYTDGWEYFNPVHLLSEGTYFSNVPPYADPSALFFAQPVSSPSAPPLARVSSDDVVKPVLSGNVEILVVFDAFLEAPGNPGDGMDAISLYALDWAVWPVGPGNPEGGYRKDQCADESKDPNVRYRISFQHSKFPRFWNSTASAYDKLFAHYVPSFKHGAFSWARETMSSQFDEKARTLVYAPTRTLRGEPDIRGSWDTRTLRNGMYWVSVRGRDYWGQIGCVTAQVRIINL
ncbi:hypothetical protein OC861_003136 [Tilletia horrida]|nr:hypothetical protein OC861_003136 [Tilletia horrida]